MKWLSDILLKIYDILLWTLKHISGSLQLKPMFALHCSDRILYTVFCFIISRIYIISRKICTWSCYALFSCVDIINPWWCCVYIYSSELLQSRTIAPCPMGINRLKLNTKCGRSPRFDRPSRSGDTGCWLLHRKWHSSRNDLLKKLYSRNVGRCFQQPWNFGHSLDIGNYVATR